MENHSAKKLKTSQTDTGVTKNENWTGDDKARLVEMLATVCTVQRTYGKTSEDLGPMVNGFCLALQKYPIQSVINAIVEYISKKPDLPTPSDITALLEPPIESFRPDWTYYEKLKDMLKNGGKYALNDEEHEYMQACENHSLSRMRNAKKKP